MKIGLGFGLTSGLGGSGSDLWTPAEITTGGWWDAQDASTITHSGGSVSQWDDKSGNGNHLVQATGSQQPDTGTVFINGKNTIDFKLANDEIMCAPNSASLNFDTDGVAIFAVLNYSGYVNQGSGLNAAISKGGLASSDLGYGIRVNSTTNSLQIKWGADLAESVPDLRNLNTLISSNIVGITASAYINGDLDGTDTAVGISSDNTSQLCFGGQDVSTQRYADVSFGEVLLVSAQMTDFERQRIEGYLAHRWGLASELPVDHPYKNNAP